jgi:Fe-S-cluster containining protein
MPPVTENEINKILKAGFENHFIRMGDELFTIKSKANGNCPYLKKDCSCMIHDVKPTLCKIWPIVPHYQNNKRGYIVIKCPLFPLISKKEFQQKKKEAEKISIQIVKHLWNISSPLKQEYKRFEYVKIL